MPDLTQDELTVLLIADEGASMIPIGRWEVPLKNLATKGLMQRLDNSNYVITEAGRQAAHAGEDANFKAVIETRNTIIQVQEKARARAEELAVLLAELSRFSASQTGDDPMKALRSWGKTILERAKELLG